MRNNKIFILAAIVLIFGATSCEKTLDSEGISRVTEYPVFTITGGEVVFNDLGIAYTDPGASASANGIDAPIKTEVEGRYSGYSGTAVNENVMDQYNVAYTAENADGLEATAVRRVMVAETEDLSTGIAGVYKATTTRGANEFDNIYIFIWKTGNPNEYEISHAYGGYYSDGRDGDGFHPNESRRGIGGTITIVDLATNNFTFTAGVLEGFSATPIILNMTVNATSKTITFDTDLAPYNLVASVSMVQL